MDEARIRLETEHDALAIAELGHAAWDATYRGLIPDEVIDAQTVARRFQRRLLRRREGDPERRTWVVEDSGGVQGYCSTGPTRRQAEDASVGEVYSLYVHPERWGRGLGKRLLEHAVADLLERGFAEVRLWCLTTNPRARNFYERNGFEVETEAEALELEDAMLPHTRYRLRR